MSKTPSNTTQYVVLEEGQPVAQPVYVVVDTKRRRLGCGGCCLIVIPLILLLSLLIPRDPALHFSKMGVTNTTEGTSLVVDMNFKSRAPVTTKWEDLDIELEWITNDGSLKLATFEQSSKFTTKAWGSTRVQPALKSRDGTIGLFATFAYNCLYDTVQVRFKGHVKTQDSKFAVKTPWNLVQCYVYA